ncbi:hypothetical protein Hanom_Chr03g00215891 [Helianthus anomalus]
MILPFRKFMILAFFLSGGIGVVFREVCSVNSRYIQSEFIYLLELNAWLWFTKIAELVPASIFPNHQPSSPSPQTTTPTVHHHHPSTTTLNHHHDICFTADNTFSLAPDLANK